jgi:hypothetical protein
VPRPNCGKHLPGSTTASGDLVFKVVGVAGTVISAGAGVATAIKGGLVAFANYPIIAAAVAAAVVVAIVITFAVERCNQNPDGVAGCIAGVIEQITPAFTGSTWDSAFPFASPHDRVDVVVKSAYWDLIDQISEFVFCSTNDNSPMMPCFYYTPAVCNAGIGASVGAGVGAVAGLFVAAAVIAAIGCASWFLCILALIVAVIIAVVAAIIGACAGGQIGKAATPQPGPSSTGNTLIPATPLSVGDYVTEQGNMVKSGDLNNALVFYFVTTTTLHGHSLNSPSFSHTDPDAMLQPDACPVTIM